MIVHVGTSGGMMAGNYSTGSSTPSASRSGALARRIMGAIGADDSLVVEGLLPSALAAR